jgi:DNA repair ATPase RecN
MGENADLEKRATEALRRYREALAKAEEMEQEEAAARRALAEWQGRVEIAILDGHASPGRSHLIQTGQATIARLHEVRCAMSEATAALDSAYRTLAALDDELGYIPTPGAANPDATGTANSPEE